MASPVSWWRANRASTSGRQHQCSMICDGASTKSRSVLVPENRTVPARVSVWCRTWPNSWNSVTTSSCSSSDGRSAVGFVRLATMADTGVRYEPSGRRRPGTRSNAAAWLNLPSRGCRSMWATAIGSPLARSTMV